MVEDSAFFRALTLPVVKSDGGRFFSTVGLSEVVVVSLDPHGKGVDILLKVSNLAANSSDLSVNLGGELVIDGFTLLLGSSLNGERVIKIGFNLVEDIKDVVNQVLGNLNWGALNHLGKETEHGTISVSKTTLGGCEASELGAQG